MMGFIVSGELGSKIKGKVRSFKLMMTKQVDFLCGSEFKIQYRIKSKCFWAQNPVFVGNGRWDLDIIDFNYWRNGEFWFSFSFFFLFSFHFWGVDFVSIMC